jgi:hypothetical protein
MTCDTLGPAILILMALGFALRSAIPALKRENNENIDET